MAIKLHNERLDTAHCAGFSVQPASPSRSHLMPQAVNLFEGYRVEPVHRAQLAALVSLQ